MSDGPARKEGGESKRSEVSRGLGADFGRFLRGAFVENASLKFVALVLSITIFILVNTDKDEVIHVDVDVAYTMPRDRVLISEPVDQLRVSIRGSWRRIRRFDERQLDPVRVDLTSMPSGEFVFQKEMIALPRGLEVLSISPLSMRLQFDKRVTKRVPVNVSLSGAPERGYKLTGKSYEPTHVTLAGPEGVVSGIEEARTREIPLEGHTSSFRTTTQVFVNRRHVEVVGSPAVEVVVSLAPELVSREFGPLPVEVRPAEGAARPLKRRFITAPAAVSVVLRGAVSSVDLITKDSLTAYVQLHSEDTTAAKQRKASVLLEGAPEGVGVEIRPREVLLKPVP